MIQFEHSVNILLYILFKHYDFSQDVEYSFLCCTIGLHRLSILYTRVCICTSQISNPPLPSFTLAITSLFLHLSQRKPKLLILVLESLYPLCHHVPSFIVSPSIIFSSIILTVRTLPVVSLGFSCPLYASSFQPQPWTVS